MKIRLHWFCFIFFMAGSVFSHAQLLTFDSVHSARLLVQGNFSLGVPIGDFGQSMERNGVGWGAEALYRIQGPAWIGLGGGMLRFDNYSIGYYDYFDGEPFEIEELTASRAAMAHVLLRFQPAHGEVFTPYVQAAVGWHWYFTNTKLTDVEFDEVIQTFSEQSDSRLGYGLQAGMLLTWPGIPNMGLDLRAGYLGNAAVNYLIYEPEEATGISGYPIDSFVPVETVVDMINIQIGFFARM